MQCSLYQKLCSGTTGDSEDGLPGEEGEQELVHRGVRGGVGQDEGGGRVRDPLHPRQVLWGGVALKKPNSPVAPRGGEVFCAP